MKKVHKLNLDEKKWAKIKKTYNQIKAKVELSEADNKLLGILACYVTLNRVNNVISKIGEIGPKDFGKVMRSEEHTSELQSLL